METQQTRQTTCQFILRFSNSAFIITGQNSHISIKHLCVSHLYCPQLALKLWHSFDLLPNFFSNICSQVFCKTLGHNSFKNENWLFASNIAALFTSHRWAHTTVDLSYMKFWNFEGKLSAWFEIKEKHSRAERRKSYLSPISISLRLLLIFWYMELSALIWG